MRNSGHFKAFPTCEFIGLPSTHLPTHLGSKKILVLMGKSFLGGLSSGGVDFMYLSSDRTLSFLLLNPICAASLSQVL